MNFFIFLRPKLNFACQHRVYLVSVIYFRNLALLGRLSVLPMMPCATDFQSEREAKT